MKDVRKLYPECQDEEYGYFIAPTDYNPLLKSFGYKIVLQVDDHGYQGDSRLLFKDGERYGILIFGWGSCSGCDALQACKSYEEIDQLRNELHDNIQWFDNSTEALRYFKEHDWEGDYSWREEGTKQFVREAIALLEKDIARKKTGGRASRT